jgi:hypothetical protein
MSNQREQAIEPSIEAAGCRVLVVEDETLIAVLIEQTLEAMDCESCRPSGEA